MQLIVRSALAALLLGAAHPAIAASTTGTGTVTVIRPITVTKVRDLAFGTIVEPTTGSADVSIDTTGTGARNTNGLGTAAGAFNNAAFTVAGEGGQAVTVSVDPSVTLSGPSSSTLTVTTSATNTGSQTLTGSLGSAGSLSVVVGGTITVSSTTTTGAYTGTFTVQATYN